MSLLCTILMAPLPLAAHQEQPEPGLFFKSYETEPDSRTSLSVEKIRFSDALSVRFDLAIEAGREPFGYVCRIVLDGSPMLDILLSTPVGGVPYVVTATPDGNVETLIPYSDIYRWNTVEIMVRDGKDGLLHCLANGKEVTCSQASGPHDAGFLFGANQVRPVATSDVAPMKLRNLSVTRGQRKSADWPLLCEVDLETGPKDIEISTANAAWHVDGHRHWTETASFRSDGIIFIADDPARGYVYLIDAHKVIRYELKDGDSEVFPFTQTIGTGRLTNDFAVLADGSLAYIDFDSEDPVRATFDFGESRWSEDRLTPSRHSRFSHHNTFLNPVDGDLVQVFGYGFHAYLGDLFHLGKKWVRQVRTDIPPRYLSSVGVCDSSAIVLGGKGNPKGKQELGVSVYDDIWKINLRDYSVSKAGTFDNQESLVPAQGLQVEGDSITALFFNPNAYKNTLQLKALSLADGKTENLADGIPFNFLDIESYAVLTRTDEALFTALSYRLDNDGFVAKIYKLDTPIFNTPASPKKAGSLPGKWKTGLWMLVFAAFATFMILLYRFSRRPGRQSFKLSKAAPLGPGVHLLGSFRVIGADNADITQAFTPTMRQLLSVLILYTARNKGISNAELKDILWDDKSEDSYFNNRGVMIKRLRAALANVSSGIEIVSDSGNWSINIPENLSDYISAITTLKNGSSAKAMTEAALAGPLLPEMRFEWLDKFKADYADMVISSLSPLNKPEILDADSRLAVSDAILSFDSIDEDAVRSKCKALIDLKRAGTAKSEFDRFTEQYSSMLGEKYGKSFAEFLNG